MYNVCICTSNSVYERRLQHKKSGWDYVPSVLIKHKGGVLVSGIVLCTILCTRDRAWCPSWFKEMSSFQRCPYIEGFRCTFYKFLSQTSPISYIFSEFLHYLRDKSINYNPHNYVQQCNNYPQIPLIITYKYMYDVHVTTYWYTWHGLHSQWMETCQELRCLHFRYHAQSAISQSRGYLEVKIKQ